MKFALQIYQHAGFEDVAIDLLHFDKMSLLGLTLGKIPHG